MLQALKEQHEGEEVKVNTCNGAQECKRALLMLRAGKLPEDFIEGMICEGGCVNGPGSVKSLSQYQVDRNKLLAQSDARTITGSIAEYSDKKIDMNRTQF